MPSRTGYGPLVPLTDLPPLLATFSRQLREAQALRRVPALPPASWEDLVDDPALRRYIGGVWTRPGLDSAFARYSAVIDARNSGTAMELGTERLVDLLPIRLLLDLFKDVCVYDSDRTKRRVLRPGRVRNQLLQRLFSVVDAALGISYGNPDAFTRQMCMIERTIFGRYSITLGGRREVIPSARHLVDEASKLLCGAAALELVGEFKRRYPALASEEIAAERECTRGERDADSVPGYFLHWAWTQRRVVTFEVCEEYGLDELHWQFLTDETNPDYQWST